MHPSFLRLAERRDLSPFGPRTLPNRKLDGGQTTLDNELTTDSENQMHDLDRTWLWRKAFSDEAGYDENEREFYRNQLTQMRERVAPVVRRIMPDMPGYTVHDITHLDALWETASLVASEGLQLNPAEAFVFGASVLLHDSAMTLAAYEGGLSELQGTSVWTDLARQRGLDQKTTDPSLITEALRLLHADQARMLPFVEWRVGLGKGSFFLIENKEVRDFYGESIGYIANSHWWSVDRLARELNTVLGSMPPYGKSNVDLLKIAALLRVADAIHLDRRRSPPFVRALDKPTGVSDLHWEFQGRLAFPRLEDDAVVFTSGEKWTHDEAGSWWLGLDAIRLADSELRNTDLLLRDNGRQPLRARRVKGAESPEELARHLRVSGWIPLDTTVHIGDVASVVRSLGGEQLYGNNPVVALREMIQNAIDAIKARRKIQGRPDDWGEIVVTLSEIDSDVWLTVADNGVGMSKGVIINHLLNFGSSLWKSSSLISEYPGLASKGMKSLGRFGIGFFSTFMLGKDVRVATRRFDASASDGMTLSFVDGLSGRPVLKIDPSNAPIDGGTSVAIKLAKDPREKSGINFSPDRTGTDVFSDLFDNLTTVSNKFDNLMAAVRYLAPLSDVTIKVVEFGVESWAVRQGDWISMDAPTFLSTYVSRPRRDDNLELLLDFILDESGVAVGRAAFDPDSWVPRGALVSGGIRVQTLRHMAGYIEGGVTSATRNQGSFSVSIETLKRWAEKQVATAIAHKLDDDTVARMAELALHFGAAIGDPPICEIDGSWVRLSELKGVLTMVDEISVHVGDPVHDDEDGCRSSEFDHAFEAEAAVIFVPTIRSGLHVGTDLFSLRGNESQLLNTVRAAVAETWGEYEESSRAITIGTVNYTDIERNGTVFFRA